MYLAPGQEIVYVLARADFQKCSLDACNRCNADDDALIQHCLIILKALMAVQDTDVNWLRKHM